MSLSKYTKTITGFIGVAAMYVYQVNMSHPNHWVTLILGVLTVLGIFQLPNTTPPPQV